jgi:hypothetical protein
LQMGSSQVIGGTETDPSRYIKTSLGSVGFSPAPGLEISCSPGRSLVSFLESTRANLAPRPGRPTNNSTTNDQQSENNADSGVESTWIPFGISSAERTKVDQPILYWSHSSRNMRFLWCKRSSEISGTRRKCQADIPLETLTVTFHEWLQRLQACIDGDGEYVE